MGFISEKRKDNTLNSLELHSEIVYPNGVNQDTVCSKNKKETNPSHGMDVLIWAFMLIFDSVQTGRDTAQIQAKGMQNSAAIQNNLISEEAQLTFMTLLRGQIFTPNGHDLKPADSLQPAINDMQAHNTRVNATRGLFENKLNVQRQKDQMDDATFNSLVDMGQQDVQQGGSLMQMLSSLTNQISRI